jgi:hypothetical protein
VVIKCKCLVYDRKSADLIGSDNAPDEWVDFAFDTDSIQGLRNGIDEEGNEIETYVYFATESFVVDMSFNEIYELWKKGKEQGDPRYLNQ